MIRYLKTYCIRSKKAYLMLMPLIFFVACFKEPVNNEIVDSVSSMDEISKQENVVPVVIIGSGPAGLSAALYVSRAGMKSFVFAGPTPCGQLTQTTYIENWPGRERILGSTLMDDIKNQAISFGATIIHDTITNIDSSSWPFAIQTEEGRSFKALAIIIATGATPKTLDVPGEREFWGKGLTTCAVCDAPFFKDREVVISGGGDSAAEMVFELAPYVKKVTVLVRKDRMRAAIAMQERVAQYPNAVVEYHKEIKAVYGDDSGVNAIDLYDNEKNTLTRMPTDGVFLAIGHTPNSAMIQGQVPLDDHGYIKMVGRSQESLVPGIFAAGEIQDPEYRQAIVAAGEGVKAALDATSFLYSRGFNVEIGHKLDQHFFESFSDEKIELGELVKHKDLYTYVLRAKGIVLLDFYGTACPACVKMIPVLESIAHKLQDTVKIYKVRYDDVASEHRTIFKDLWFNQNIQVKKIPALLVFKDGQFLDMTYNIMSRKELYQYLQKFM